MKLNRRILQVREGIPLKEEDLGEVRLKVLLTNAGDEEVASRGLMKPEEIRSMEVEAVVDTGAVRSVIPKFIVEQLGLAIDSTRTVMYADGRQEDVPVTRAVRIELQGRATYEACLVLGNAMLICQTALESTDLLVDCFGGKLVPNPEHPKGPVLEVRNYS
jgi:clan AA aspartic protease